MADRQTRSHTRRLPENADNTDRAIDSSSSRATQHPAPEKVEALITSATEWVSRQVKDSVLSESDKGKFTTAVEKWSSTVRNGLSQYVKAVPANERVGIFKGSDQFGAKINLPNANPLYFNAWVTPSQESLRVSFAATSPPTVQFKHRILSSVPVPIEPPPPSELLAIVISTDQSPEQVHVIGPDPDTMSSFDLSQLRRVPMNSGVFDFRVPVQGGADERGGDPMDVDPDPDLMLLEDQNPTATDVGDTATAIERSVAKWREALDPTQSDRHAQANIITSTKALRGAIDRLTRPSNTAGAATQNRRLRLQVGAAELGVRDGTYLKYPAWAIEDCESGQRLSASNDDGNAVFGVETAVPEAFHASAREDSDADHPPPPLSTSPILISDSDSPLTVLAGTPLSPSPPANEADDSDKVYSPSLQETLRRFLAEQTVTYRYERKFQRSNQSRTKETGDVFVDPDPHGDKDPDDPDEYKKWPVQQLGMSQVCVLTVQEGATTDDILRDLQDVWRLNNVPYQTAKQPATQGYTMWKGNDESFYTRLQDRAIARHIKSLGRYLRSREAALPPGALILPARSSCRPATSSPNLLYYPWWIFSQEEIGQGRYLARSLDDEEHRPVKVKVGEPEEDDDRLEV